MVRNSAPDPNPVAVANIGTDGIELVVCQESLRAAMVSPREAVAVMLQAVAEILPHTGLVGGICDFRSGRRVCGAGDSAGIWGVDDWSG